MYLHIVVGINIQWLICSGIKKSKPRKNNIYIQNFIVFPTLNYNRTICIGDYFGFLPRIGIGYYGEAIYPLLEGSLIIEKNRHCSEIGAGYWAFDGAVINVNYRYMSKKGQFL